MELLMTNEWQPIETAPRDGRALLLWGIYAGEINGIKDVQVIDVGYYSNGKSDYGSEGWWNSSGGDAYACWVRPTHWMPLPNPPKQPD